MVLSSSFSTKLNYLFVVTIAVAATSIINHNTNNCILFVDAQKQSTNACTPCVKGADMINKEAGVCIDFPSRTNGLFNTDTDCKAVQLVGYQIGCCPSPPTTDHCEYCEDGSAPDLDAIVPTGQFVEGYTCFDYSYQNEAYIGMFTDGDCSDTFLQRAGFYCGCPAQEQECWLCPDQQPPTNPYKHETWVTNSNCRELEYFFSILKEDECEAFPFQAEAAVATAKKCIVLNDQWAKEHVRLASAYIALGLNGNSNDACNALKRALQLEARNPTARDMLIRVLRSRDHGNVNVNVKNNNSNNVNHDSSEAHSPSAPPQHMDNNNNNNHNNNSSTGNNSQEYSRRSYQNNTETQNNQQPQHQHNSSPPRDQQQNNNHNHTHTDDGIDIDINISWQERFYNHVAIKDEGSSVALTAHRSACDTVAKA